MSFSTKTKPAPSLPPLTERGAGGCVMRRQGGKVIELKIGVESLRQEITMRNGAIGIFIPLILRMWWNWQTRYT